MRKSVAAFAIAFAACTDPTALPSPHDVSPAFNNGGPPAAYALSFVIDGICPYPLRVELDGKEKLIFRPNGSLIVTSPGLWARLTNLDTGASAVEGITGAIRVTFLDNGDAVIGLTGRNLVEDDTGLFLTIGTFSQVIDSNGNYVQPLTGKGSIIDVCTLLG